jgi:hypothetical protein
LSLSKPGDEREQRSRDDDPDRVARHGRDGAEIIIWETHANVG